MTQSVPTREPSSATAGDTLKWTKSLADYPATAGWVLKYRLINAVAKIDFTAAASGADHAVTVSAATTAAWAAGTYDWQAYVEGGASERHTIGTGRVIIKPNLAAQATGYDARSTARKTLELIDAAMLAHGSKAWTAEYEVAGRRMKFKTPGDFLVFRNKIRAEVAAEEHAERLAAGLSPKSRILVRF